MISGPQPFHYAGISFTHPADVLRLIIRAHYVLFKEKKEKKGCTGLSLSLSLSHYNGSQVLEASIRTLFIVRPFKVPLL